MRISDWSSDVCSSDLIDGVHKADYPKVTEQCYLCDLCYQTKCPYTPPHPWNVDFPHLMLRAKAVAFERDGAPLSSKILSSTRTVGKLASIPVVVQVINAANRNPAARQLLEKTLGVDANARSEEHTSELQSLMRTSYDVY